jgi:hypothetical protein
MKRLISSIFITGCLWGIAYLSEYQQPPQATVSVSTSRDLLGLQQLISEN